jgi:ribonucleoside-diphosphate reductase alpha chain
LIFFTNELDLGRKVFTTLERLLPKPGIVKSRPNSLDAKVHRIELNGKKWAIFVGYLNGKPLEIWTCNLDYDEGFLVPDWVNKGLITCREDNGVQNFDFTFRNKRGYKTTVEGLNYLFDYQINTYDKIVTKLLQSNVHLSVVINTIRDMHFSNKNHRSWNSQLITALNN